MEEMRPRPGTSGTGSNSAADTSSNTEGPKAVVASFTSYQPSIQADETTIQEQEATIPEQTLELDVAASEYDGRTPGIDHGASDSSHDARSNENGHDGLTIYDGHGTDVAPLGSSCED